MPLINAHFHLIFCLFKIVDDALKLARFSYSNYKTALRVVDYLQNEIDYVPWAAAFSNFDFILGRLKPSEELLFKVNQWNTPSTFDFSFDQTNWLYLFRNSKQNFWTKSTSIWASIRKEMINSWIFWIELMWWKMPAKLVPNCA